MPDSVTTPLVHALIGRTRGIIGKTNGQRLRDEVSRASRPAERETEALQFGESAGCAYSATYGDKEGGDHLSGSGDSLCAVDADILVREVVVPLRFALAGGECPAELPQLTNPAEVLSPLGKPAAGTDDALLEPVGEMRRQPGGVGEEGGLLVGVSVGGDVGVRQVGGEWVRGEENA